MAVISTLAVNIIAKTAGFTRGVRSTRASMNKFNSTVKNTKRLLTGLIAGTGVIRGFRALIRVASEAQETMAKFNTVFRGKGGAREVEAWADSFARAVGRSRQDIKSYLAELQDIFVPLGFGRDEAAKFAKSITQLGVDVASFNEKVDRDVMRNFTSALMGSHRAVRQYGVAISESRIQTESYNTGLNKSFASLTDMEKIYLRYVIILNDTRDAQGDATRTQDDFANQLKRTKGRIKDLTQEIGAKLLPHLVGVLKVVRGVIDHFSTLAATTGGVTFANVRLIASVGAFLFIFPKIVIAISRIVKALKGLAKAQAITQAFGGPAGIASLVAGAAIAGVAVAALDAQFNKLAETVDKLSKEKGEFKSIGEQIQVTMGDIEQSLLKSGGAKPVIIKTIQSLNKELNKLALTANQLTRFELADELGISQFNVRGKALFDALNIMLQIRGLYEKKAVGKSIFEDMMTPMEKYTKRIYDLGRMLDIGAFSWETYGRAVRAAREELEASRGAWAGPGGAKVIREAFVSVSGLAMGTKDPSLNKMDKQIQELEKSNTHLRSIDERIGNLRDKLADIPLKLSDAITPKLPGAKAAGGKFGFTKEQLGAFPKDFFGTKPAGLQFAIPQGNLSLRHHGIGMGWAGRSLREMPGLAETALDRTMKATRPYDPFTAAGEWSNAAAMSRGRIKEMAFPSETLNEQLLQEAKKTNATLERISNEGGLQ